MKPNLGQCQDSWQQGHVQGPGGSKKTQEMGKNITERSLVNGSIPEVLVLVLQRICKDETSLGFGVDHTSLSWCSQIAPLKTPLQQAVGLSLFTLTRPQVDRRVTKSPRFTKDF